MKGVQNLRGGSKSGLSTDTVVMVRPFDFGFNEETSGDNQFQTRPTISEHEINLRANREFENFVDTLRSAGVTVLILENHGRILSVDLETIENVGGGSTRCMLAEIFIPR